MRQSNSQRRRVREPTPENVRVNRSWSRMALLGNAINAVKTMFQFLLSMGVQFSTIISMDVLYFAQDMGQEEHMETVAQNIRQVLAERSRSSGRSRSSRAWEEAPRGLGVPRG